MKRIFLLLSASLFLSHGIARAGIVDIALLQPVLSGSPGDVLAFFGTITNTTGSPAFLNADNFNGVPPGYLDDSPFFANTPAGFLDPFGSTGLIELFDVTVPDFNIIGSFEILGGAAIDDQTVLASADFTVFTPEPSSMALMFAAMAAAACFRRSLAGFRTHRAPLVER